MWQSLMAVGSLTEAISDTAHLDTHTKKYHVQKPQLEHLLASC